MGYSKTMTKDVHRLLGVNTPYLTGPDVKALQSACNRLFKHFKIDRRIKEDGEFGPATLSACLQMAVASGVGKRGYKDLKNGTVNRSVQRLIRGRKKTARERLATKRRARYRKKLRAKLDTSRGEKVIRWAKTKVGVTESPAGSNWGPEIGEWIRFTGYSGPVYWCGCFACYAVVKIGGAKIPSRIRLGFNEYIIADALAHNNGLVAVGFSEARAGDIVLYTFPHIGLIEKTVADTAYTVEGNTSPGTSGSQSNGGGVFARTRSRSEVRCIARPDYS